MKRSALLAAISVFPIVGAFTTSSSQHKNVRTVLAATSRRSFVATAGGVLASSLFVPSARAQDEIPWTPFNGLIFNYRGADHQGLDASTLNEPSIPFQEFGEKLEAGQVAFVEFLAPDGDAAYVTLKPTEKEPNPKPIRIGEGYPIEQHDGWSSPAFVVRAVENFKVPYKFTIPALAKFRVNST